MDSQAPVAEAYAPRPPPCSPLEEKAIIQARKDVVLKDSTKSAEETQKKREKRKRQKLRGTMQKAAEESKAASSSAGDDSGKTVAASTEDEGGNDLEMQVAVVAADDTPTSEEQKQLDAALRTTKDKVCHMCPSFSDPLLASDFLLAKGDAPVEWCGRIWGVCFDHSDFAENGPTEEAKKAFHNAVKKAWTQKLQEAKGVQRRARNISFSTLEAIVRELYPGIKREQVRKITVMRLKAAATTMALAYAGGSAQYKVEVDKEQLEYLKEVERMVADPTIATKSHVLQQELQYLTKLNDQLAICFCCRDCLFFARNDQWIRHATRHEFRCPMCKVRYAPWKIGAAKAPFQKVIVITDPLTSSDVVIPALWPQTAEDNYFGGLMQAHLHEMQRVAKQDVGGMENLLLKDVSALSEFLGPYQCHHALVHQPWSTANTYMLTEPNYGPATYNNLIFSGVYGGYFKWDPLCPIPIFQLSDWSTLAALIGNVTQHGNAMQD
jgi:hypothetical protein